MPYGDSFWNPVMGAVDTIASDIQKRKEQARIQAENQANEARSMSEKMAGEDRAWDREKTKMQIDQKYKMEEKDASDPYVVLDSFTSKFWEGTQGFDSSKPVRKSVATAMNQMAQRGTNAQANMTRANRPSNPPKGSTPEDQTRKLWEKKRSELVSEKKGYATKPELRQVTDESGGKSWGWVSPDEEQISMSKAYERPIGKIDKYLMGQAEPPENLTDEIVMPPELYKIHQEAAKAGNARSQQFFNTPYLKTVPGSSGKSMSGGQQQIPPEIQQLPPEDQQAFIQRWQAMGGTPEAMQQLLQAISQ